MGTSGTRGGGGAAVAGGLVVSESGRGWDARGGATTPGGGALAAAGAAGGTTARGSAVVRAGEDGGTCGMPCGVGRRPGANGGTRVGVALRGNPAGGVSRGELPNAVSIPERSVAEGPPATAVAAPDALATERADDVRLAASCGVAKSSVQLRAAVMEMMPPHTEHRARTPGPGTRAGSTRNTDWHSGHETFMTRRLG